MNQIINKHNKKVISKEKKDNVTKCNCRKKDECKLNVKCMITNTVYNATVETTSQPTKYYIGITEGPWKYRHAVHQTSFRYKDYKARTRLTDYVWRTKDFQAEMPNIKWSI